MNKFAAALLIGGAFIVGYNLVAPIEYTIPARLGRLLGEFEAQWTEARTEAVANQAQEIQEAEAEVQRKTMATARAIEAEADVMRRQVAATNSTHWLKSIGANIADGICGFGVLGAAVGTKDNEEFLAFCSVGDEVRRGMAEDYAETLNNSRSTIMEDMTRAFDRAHEGGNDDDKAQ